MEQIEIAVAGAEATLTAQPLLTAGRVGLQVRFTFDQVWDHLEKTAIFRAGGTSVLCRQLENVTQVPWQVMKKAGCTLYAGVYGLAPDGSVAIPTLWVSVGTIQPGADPEGTESCDPSLPVWKQALDAAQQAEETAKNLQQAADRGAFDGYSPVRGVDYWTEADKEEIRTYVDEAILGGAW